MATTKTAENDTPDLAAELAELRDAFAKMTKDFKAMAADKAEGAAATAAERVVSLKAAGERQVEKVAEGAKDIASKAESYVQEHPATTIAASAALGFFIGALFARR